MVGSPSSRALAACALTLLLGGCGSSSKQQASSKPAATTAPAPPSPIRLSSPAFAEGGRIPVRFTCDDIDDSPPLRWSGVPAGTAQLALLLEDPGAPGGTFTHWAVFDIPPTTAAIAQGAIPRGARQGTTSFSQSHYGGPCPPHGDAAHRYVFTLYALRAPLSLPQGAPPEDLRAAVTRVTLAVGRLTATYTRA